MSPLKGGIGLIRERDDDKITDFASYDAVEMIQERSSNKKS